MYDIIDVYKDFFIKINGESTKVFSIVCYI